MVYLDNAATTQCDPLVIEHMSPFWREHYGNPSSAHFWGRQARKAVEDARRQILTCLEGVGNLIFTGSATEANNIAVATVGHLIEENAERRRVLVLATEHKSVLSPLRVLSRGSVVKVDIIPVLQSGVVDQSVLLKILDETVIAVFIQMVNSETGVIQDVQHIAAAAHAVGALCISDITQGVGKLPVNLEALGVDMAIFSAHKVYGPKGIGALYVRPKVPIAPIIFGGNQERGLRSGTENVPAIVGFASAVTLACEQLNDEMTRIAVLRDMLWNRLAELGRIRWNGEVAPKVSTHLNITIDGVSNQDLMLRVHDIAFSAGSACNASSNTPSEVLQAMGLSLSEAEQTVRFSLGRFVTPEDIEYAADRIQREIVRIRRETCT
ncbi:cysteine desulfurase family protein [Sulfobacillus thermosulfidooxidans]|uniref:cysteine desulfurase family protein n=1 Tax=Sulfobacillus thermosulfidooxidans TaxID=28034 RepID=UPI0002EFB1DD|nr:cysteine desulfurase family protein [Sulfobacillus thermosulfidooxidans]